MKDSVADLFKMENPNWLSGAMDCIISNVHSWKSESSPLLLIIQMITLPIQTTGEQSPSVPSHFIV